MAFHIGQKVVCVEAFNEHINPPRVGGIYTVERLTQGETLAGFTLIECPAAGNPLGWVRYKFRPVVEKSTDVGMAILREILDRESVSDRRPVRAK